MLCIAHRTRGSIIDPVKVIICTHTHGPQLEHDPKSLHAVSARCTYFYVLMSATLYHITVILFIIEVLI